MADESLANELRREMQYWGITDTDLGLAWYDKSFNHSVFATAHVFPLTFAGIDGLVVACSTSASNSMQQWHSSQSWYGDH